jgi:hypothetical protein
MGVEPIIRLSPWKAAPLPFSESDRRKHPKVLVYVSYLILLETRPATIPNKMTPEEIGTPAAENTVWERLIPNCEMIKQHEIAKRPTINILATIHLPSMYES